MFNYFSNNNYNTNLVESTKRQNIKTGLLVFVVSFLTSILFIALVLNLVHTLAKVKTSRFDYLHDDPTAVYNTRSLNINSICGLSNPFRNRTNKIIKINRIINGDTAIPNRYPWVVSFRLIDKSDSKKLKSHFCAGSLINANYILSTAHCFSTRNISKIAVVVGSNSLNDKLNESNIYYIKEIFSHPSFDSKKDYINDIALIKLNKPVNKFNYLVMPICLPNISSDKFDIVGKEVTLVGWGYIDYHAKTLATSLKQMNRIISNNASLCSYIRFNPKTTYCAINSNKIQDTCNGDSGGPMMIEIEKRWFLYGLTSFGDTSCNPLKSSYYSKITIYLDWIYNIINNN
jgi:hypothetical protein